VNGAGGLIAAALTIILGTGILAVLASRLAGPRQRGPV
jgi:hypothetical protein